MKNLISLSVIGLLLASCASLPQAEPTPPGAPSHPTETPGGAGPAQPAPIVPTIDCSKLTFESTCPKPGEYQGVDSAVPITDKALKVYWCLGVRSVFRYYDWQQETIKGKTLWPGERDRIHALGMSTGVVFQHNNNQLASFTAERGKIDALRSLELAKVNAQPLGSTIWFGADKDFYTASEQKAVRAYAEQFCGRIRGAGYECGVYGSGLTAKNLQDAGVVERTWLSQSVGWAGFKAYEATKRWSMKQSLIKMCGGQKVDFNVVSKQNHNGVWPVRPASERQ